MVPFAAAAAEYGALASRGSFTRITDALSAPDLVTIAWVTVAVAVVVLATRRSGRLALVLLLLCAVALAVKAFDLW